MTIHYDNGIIVTVRDLPMFGENMPTPEEIAQYRAAWDAEQAEWDRWHSLSRAQQIRELLDEAAALKVLERAK